MTTATPQTNTMANQIAQGGRPAQAALMVQHNDAATGSHYKLGDALGLERGTVYGFKGGSIFPGGDADMKLFRDKMKELGPEKTMSALIESSTGDQKALLVKMREKGLSGPLHTALTGDEATLPQLQGILESGKTGAGFNIADLNGILDDDLAASNLGKVLTKVGDGSKFTAGPNKGKDINLGHATVLLKQFKDGKLDDAVGGLNAMGIEVNPLADVFSKLNINGFEDILRILMNPQELIQTLLQASPELAQNDMFMGFAVPAIEAFAPLAGRAGQNLQAFGKRVQSEVSSSAAHNRGEYGVKGNFQTNYDGKTSELTKAEFNEKFTEAMKGRERDFNNPEHVRAAMIEVDTKLADEIAELNGDPTLTNKFDASVRSGTTLEKIQEMAQKFYSATGETHNVKTGVNAMAPGGTG